jgi:hypothetical protein
MKTSQRIKIIVSIFLFVFVIGFSATAQAATWMYSHGNVAQIEYPDICTYHYFGWGLDIDQDSGMWNWIHMTVPSPYGVGQYGARFIRLKFYTGSADAFISQIDVYNGNTKVRTFKGLSISDGWKDMQFDLGKKYNFGRGLGISIKIGAGVEMMSHRFIFSSAGASFY